jgi:glycosyltransferase involved in cell wall biosynthesis
MHLLFWGGIGAVLYSLAGFPLLVLLRGTFLRRPVRAAPITPSVSLIVSARNEVDAIGAKLDTLMALDYPREQLDVVVASDGSTDGTNEVVETFAAAGVRLLALPRVGKAAALNAAVASSSGEIVVFSDANSLFAPGTLRALVAPFADPEVGGVAGDQRYLPADGATGERSYWSFDRLLKTYESRAGHVISATGAIYAVRRELFEPVPDAVTDDFVVSTGVIERGRRLVFAPDAVAYEPATSSDEAEFGRKVRIMTRGFRGVLVRRALLDPRRHGFYAFQLLSHKVLRRLLVVPLAAVALASVALAGEGRLYRAALVAQAGFYGAAAIGLLARDERIRRHPAVALPAFFCLVHGAALMALLNLLRGKRIDRWEPVRDAASDRASAGTDADGG